MNSNFYQNCFYYPQPSNQSFIQTPASPAFSPFSFISFTKIPNIQNSSLQNTILNNLTMSERSFSKQLHHNQLTIKSFSPCSNFSQSTFFSGNSQQCDSIISIEQCPNSPIQISIVPIVPTPIRVQKKDVLKKDCQDVTISSDHKIFEISNITQLIESPQDYYAQLQQKPSLKIETTDDLIRRKLNTCKKSKSQKNKESIGEKIVNIKKRLIDNDEYKPSQFSNTVSRLKKINKNNKHGQISKSSKKCITSELSQ